MSKFMFIVTYCLPQIFCIIGALSTSLGIFVIKDAKRKSDKEEVIGAVLLIILGIICIIGGALIGIGSNSSVDKPYGNQLMVIIGYVLLIAVIIALSLMYGIKFKLLFGLPLISILVFLCVYTIITWDVQPKPDSPQCSGNRPFYVCEYKTRRDGTKYKECRCKSSYR